MSGLPWHGAVIGLAIGIVLAWASGCSTAAAANQAIFLPAQITRPMQCTSSSPQSGQSG